MEHLEKQSRGKNIRIVGLKEGKKEMGKVMQYVETFLSKGLGVTCSNFDIKQAHQNIQSQQVGRDIDKRSKIQDHETCK